MSIQLGDASWQIGADTTELQEGLEQARTEVSETGEIFSESTEKMATRVSLAGAAVVGAFAMSVKATADKGTELIHLRDTMGMTVEEIEVLEFAASQMNLEFRMVENGIRDMTRQTEDWIQAGEDSTGTLNELGIALGDLEDATPHERFEMFADAIARVDDHNRRAALSVEIFGSKAGVEMLPLLQQGSAGLEEFGDVMEEAGIGMGTDGAEAAEEFGDQLDILWRQVEQVWLEIGQALIPTLQEVIPQITDTIGGILQWIQANPELTASIIKWAGAIGMVSMALKPMIAMIKAAAVAKAALMAVSGPAGWAILAGAAAAAGGALYFINQTIPGPEEMEVSPEIEALGTEAMQDAIEGDLSDLDIDIPGAARGGFHRGLTLVGEEGPELVDMGPGGRVFDHDTSRSMLAEGGITVHADLRGAYIRDPRDTELLAQDLWKLVRGRGV